MSSVPTIVLTLLFVHMMIASCGVQASLCRPGCRRNEKCLWTGLQRGLRPFVCVPRRCLFVPRRGRCRSYRHPYHFHRPTMSCRRDRTGACYGRRNRFTTLEDCQLTCSPSHRG